MNQPKISIIIPVYNPGKYFEKCLNSLVNQTLKEIEIIIVLDCPTDGSDKVAERFAAADKRIKLLYNTEKLHIGFSRNRGLEIARGKYTGFHDSDDYSEPEMFELLYQKAEQEKLEIARCNFYCIYTQKATDNIEQYKYPVVSEAVSDKKWIYEYVSGDKVSCVIWNHIFRTDFLQKHNIKCLDTRVVCSEDSIFFMEAYRYAERVGIVKDYLYHHIFHTSNTGKAYSYRSVGNRISFFEEIYSFLKNNSVDEQESLSYLSVNVARSLYSGSRKALLSFAPKKALREIGQIGNSKLMMSCIAHLYRKENHPVRRKLKPTIRIFLRLIRLQRREANSLKKEFTSKQ